MAEKIVAQETIPANPMICSLIQKAMSKIGAIGKDSAATNYNGKMMYKFRGIDAVYNALNPVMAELGLFIIPEVLDQKREERLSSNNSNLIYSILTVKFTMYAPDGSSVAGTVIGEGMDSGDKASNKAMSAALKYFCFQTFMIPTEDMSDADAEVQEVTPVRKAPTPPKPVKNDNPPQVTVADRLPVNPVLNYLANEKAYLAKKLGKTELEMKLIFKGWYKDLLASGAIEDVSWDDMTMQQAKDLISAINSTYVSGEKK